MEERRSDREVEMTDRRFKSDSEKVIKCTNKTK